MLCPLDQYVVKVALGGRRMNEFLSRIKLLLEGDYHHPNRDPKKQLQLDPRNDLLLRLLRAKIRNTALMGRNRRIQTL